MKPWRTVIVFVLLAFLAIALIGTQAPSYQACQTAHSEDTNGKFRPPLNRAERLTIRTAAFLPCEGVFLDANRELVFGALTVLATLIIAGFTSALKQATDGLNNSTKLLWETANRQLQTTNRQLEIDQRPWLSIDAEIIDDLTWKADIPELVLQLTITNHGKSPAINFWVARQLLLPGVDAEKTQNESSEGTSTPRLFRWNVLFPGKEESFHAHQRPAEAHHEPFRLWLKEQDKKTCTIRFVGCVDYLSELRSGAPFPNGFLVPTLPCGTKGGAPKP
jgi:hypothetical protein